MPDFLETLSSKETDQENNTVLGEIMKAVGELQDVRFEIERTEDALSALKKKEEKLSGQVIPEFFQQHGLTELKLLNGQRVSISEDLSASIPVRDAAKRAIALKWLADHGGGELIKDTLTVDSPETDIVKLLQERGYEMDINVSVNSNSLKAFLKESLGMKKGSTATIEVQDVPQELGLYIYAKTKIV